MEPDRLVEVLLIGRPVRTRIARVPESLAIRHPRDVAAGSRVLHARDRLANLLAGCHVEDVEAAVLAASLRQRHRNALTVRRRLEPVERGAARRIELVRVEYDASLRRVGVLPHHDDLRLLELRVRVHRKQLATLGIEAQVARRRLLGKGLEPRAQWRPEGQRIEVSTGSLRLCFGPCLHLGVLAILEPAVRIGHPDTMQYVGRVGRSGDGRGRVARLGWAGQGERRHQGDGGAAGNHGATLVGSVAQGARCAVCPRPPRSSRGDSRRPARRSRQRPGCGGATSSSGTLAS